MTDLIEDRLRRAAGAASTGAGGPGLPALRARARRRRAAALGAPLAVALAVAATAAAAGLGTGAAQGRGAGLAAPGATTGPGDAREVVFTVRPPGIGSRVLPSPSAEVGACLGLPGAGPAETTLTGGYTVTVRGVAAIAAFQRCADGLAGHAVRRSDRPAPGLEDARARWAARGAEDYTFLLRRECFCDVRTYGVTVIGGDAVAVDDVTGEDRPAPDRFRLSVDDLFGLIAADPAVTAAAYDPETGHPTRIDVDPDAGSIDDEYAYVVTGYTPSPGEGRQGAPGEPGQTGRHGDDGNASDGPAQPAR